MDQEKIGRFIAQKRKERGLTQRELAEQLGIGDKAVSKWECGRGMPDNSIMIPLCSLLGINVNELLSGESLSAKDYNEKAEDIIMTLMKEKEILKKDNTKPGIVGWIGSVILIGILLILSSLGSGVDGWANGWERFVDIVSVLMDLMIVILLLIVTGKKKAFFRTFRLLHRKEQDAELLFASLQAVKLAITAFLLGGGLTTIISMVHALNADGRESRVMAAVALLSMFYGILFAIILLPVKVKVEACYRQAGGEES